MRSVRRELSACGRIEKQVPDFERRSGRVSGWFGRTEFTTVTIDRPSRIFAACPRCKFEMGNRCDARQRLTAESKSRHTLQTLEARYFARRVAG